MVTIPGTCEISLFNSLGKCANITYYIYNSSISGCRSKTAEIKIEERCTGMLLKNEMEELIWLRI